MAPKDKSAAGKARKDTAKGRNLAGDGKTKPAAKRRREGATPA